jgi:hypothetical protein
MSRGMLPHESVSQFPFYLKVRWTRTYLPLNILSPVDYDSAGEHDSLHVEDESMANDISSV